MWWGSLDGNNSSHRFRCAFAVVALAVSGCDKREPAIVIDSWWTIDYARNWCATHSNCGSDRDNPAGVLDYISKLKSAFALEATCHGVQIIEFLGPDTASRHKAGAMAQPHEMLMIDYVPNNPIQHWGIEGAPSAGIGGIDSIDQIVKKTCETARAVGGKVQ